MSIPFRATYFVLFFWGGEEAGGISTDTYTYFSLPRIGQ